MPLKKYCSNIKGSLLLYFMLQIIETHGATIDLPSSALESRIINGQEVAWESTRYQVSIRLEKIDRYFFGAGHYCGGSIIARNMILTAAHCVWNENTNKFREASEFSIVMGNLDRSLNNNNTLKLSVSNIITGSHFNETTFTDDLAIMFLNQSIPENYSRASVIELNDVPNIKDGKKCTVTGWGLTETAVYTRNLMFAEVPIINRATCSLNYSSEIILDGMLCAGYMQGVRDACSGDSGGPLVCDNKLVGIVSFGLGCALPGYPGVYTNIAYYAEWLRNQTGLVNKQSDLSFVRTNYTITNYTNTNTSSIISCSSFVIALLTLFSFIKYYWHIML